MDKNFKSLHPIKLGHLRGYLEGARFLKSEKDQFDVLVRGLKPEQKEKLKWLWKAWGHLYELPVHVLVFKMLQTAGKAGDLVKAVSSPVPIDSVLALGKELAAGPAPTLSLEDAPDILGLCYVSSKNIESTLVYGQSLHNLLLVLRNGNDSALFKAIRIDPLVVTSPVCAERIAKAQLLKEQDFLAEVQKALDGPPDKIKPRYDELRLVLALLRENGILQKLSIEERFEILAVQLDLYPSKEGAARSLNQFIYNWEKSLST